MGKSISGKELGKGLGQRKDGLYYARYKDNNEKWQEKCFKKLTDARNWQQEQLYLAHHAVEQRSVSDMTVDEWFCYWMDTQLTGLSPNTQRNYRERYEKNAKNILGKMRLSEVKQDWRAGPSKTKKSYRTIPLTNRAYQILQELYLGRQPRKESPELQKSLTYLDRKTGSEKSFWMRDLVFVNWRTGMPAKNSSYDTHLYKLCDQAGIDHFCMHALTSATDILNDCNSSLKHRKSHGKAAHCFLVGFAVWFTQNSIVWAFPRRYLLTIYSLFCCKMI